MDLNLAKKLGRKESLRLTLYFFLLGELIMLFLITNGDFANGILFFIQEHIKLDYLIILIILFVSTYFFGQRNGIEILILRRNFFVTPFKNGLLTFWITLAYPIAVVVFKRYGDKTSVNIIQTFILEPYGRATLLSIIPLIIYSYFCGFRIKSYKNNLEYK